VKHLNLFAAGKSVALIGDNRSGKTTFIAHHILYEMFPWCIEPFFRHGDFSYVEAGSI
jgi:hypothetical protein